MPDPYEAMTNTLEETGDYRVLRRLQPRDEYALRPKGKVYSGIILDTETTGLDVASAEVIELGMIKFDYRPDGRVFRVLDEFNQLQQPSAPIPAEIKRVTGITDAMVAGQAIDASAVERFVADASVVIAHNAALIAPCARRTGACARR